MSKDTFAELVESHFKSAFKLGQKDAYREAREFLAELLEEVEDRYDTDDDSNSRPVPNAWMRLGTRITEWMDSH